MADVNHIRLDEIRDPMLVSALRRWFQICGEGGLYPREELGFGLLVGTPEVMNGHSAVFATDTGEPLDFLIAYYGSDLDPYNGRSLVAQRLRNLPDRDVAEAAAACCCTALTARQPIAHRFTGNFQGMQRTYDRLILPTVNAAGQIDRLIHIYHEISASSVATEPVELELRRRRETIETTHAQYRLERCG